ncbi:MAG TPA: proline--tRNA ligase [Thermomicrobiales bacterium]|nr:proline--tRNA ligase [Thermomicrobiales bacterium]
MATATFVDQLIDPGENFDQWYVDVVQQAELADDAPVRGMKVVRPYGYRIWELIQQSLDGRFKRVDIENAYFPMLIPKSMLEKEAEHIEGFSPEVAWVTRGGDKELEEPLAVRPTSEAIICPIYASWVQSWRDLPLLLNQWASVVRWEDRPRAFLRTSEFLWQEGHTCHASATEANARARQMLDIYLDFIERELAIPGVPGTKSESEKFAGAHQTYTVETMMGGKNWALQSCTSHDLADHFGKVFGIEFLDQEGTRRHAFNTSWGLSHRTIGAVVMVHGDERGLKLPPRVAPIQAIIVPILGRKGNAEAVLAAAEEIRSTLADIVRVKVDIRDDRSPGYKFNHWELRGVPIRIEIGPRDLEAGQVVLALRDTGEKLTVPLAELPAVLPGLLDKMQDRLFTAAHDRLRALTVDVADWETLAERVATNAGWNRVWWCGNATCETRIKVETKATIRCIPFDQPGGEGSCIVCGSSATQRAIVARAY